MVKRTKYHSSSCLEFLSLRSQVRLLEDKDEPSRRVVLNHYGLQILQFLWHQLKKPISGLEVFSTNHSMELLRLLSRFDLEDYKIQQ